MPDPPKCGDDEHAGRRVVRAGRRRERQRWKCVASAGGQDHFFTTDAEPAAVATHPVRCPRHGHAGASLSAHGTRTTASGTWRRYRCRRADGETHTFSVLITEERQVLTARSLPPTCPHHEGSKVVRDGTYGRDEARRQRYRCTPQADGDTAAKVHSFVPGLSRKYVHVGVEGCPTCDELLSPHRGTLTGARHTPWDLATFAVALNDLSLGQSYAATGLAMRERRGRIVEHLTVEHGFSLDELPAGARSASTVAEEGAKAWHLAADLVESYSPLLLEATLAPVRAREAAQRAANDALRADDPHAVLPAPVVFMLDELPVKVRRRRSRQHEQWFILAVLELRFSGGGPKALPRHENRIRLLRAYPGADATAWGLVLTELGTRPDFVIADCGSAISKALTAQYGATVPHIPSLFHIHRNVRDGIKELPGTTETVRGREVLIGNLNKHLDRLTRDELLARTPAEWARWWDDITSAVAAIPAPVARLLNQRPIYEPKLEAALPWLQSHPHLPASNAGIEHRLRATLDPFLTARKQRYRNLARVNYLLDLATCRDQGAFRNLDAVAKLIRDSNEGAYGWAPAPRTLADTQPPSKKTKNGGRRELYTSLFNPLLVPAIAERRSLKPPTAPPPVPAPAAAADRATPAAAATVGEPT